MQENPYPKHCGVYGAKWSLKGAKSVAEQIKRKHSRHTEEVPVGIHFWCRSTLTRKGFVESRSRIGPISFYKITKMPLTNVDRKYICLCQCWGKKHILDVIILRNILRFGEKVQELIQSIELNSSFSISNLIMQFIRFIFMSCLLIYE